MDWEDFQTSSQALTHPESIHQVGAKHWIEQWIQRGEQEYRYFRETILNEVKSIQTKLRLSKRPRS